MEEENCLFGGNSKKIYRLIMQVVLGLFMYHLSFIIPFPFHILLMY